jgi:hypothetical protein
MNLSQPQPTDSMVRLALTPVLDGKLEAEEWDQLSGSTYFQWEPETLYWAAKAAANEDVVMSLDYNADGWLVGDDNLEIRIRMEGGEARVRVRHLDASDPAGPQWKDGGIAPESVKLAAVPVEGGGWVLESSYTPPFQSGLMEGRKLGVRIDLVPSGLDLGEAYLPRGLSFLSMQLDSSRGLLPEMSWRPMIDNRSVAREDHLKVRFEISRDTEALNLTRYEFRGEGLARDVLGSGNQPFPPFNRNKASLNIDSMISKTAVPGWRVIRAELQGPKGEPILLRTSVRIADLIDFEIPLREPLRASTDMQVIKTSITLRSQFSGRMEGIFSVEVPSDWSVTKNKEHKFSIFHSRGTAKVPVEIVVPRNIVGVFPITFRAKIGNEEMFKTIYLPID